MKSPVMLEVWAGLVWFTVGTMAGLLTISVELPPVRGPAALAETLLCGPLAVWLALMAARALASGEWQGLRSPVSLLAMRETYWAYMAITMVLSACFLSLFVRGFLSLSLML
jgi:hypothetical protein